MTAGVATERWSRREVVAFAAVILAGIAIRVVLLPTPGLRGDLDQFVGWVHAIATNGLGSLYGQNAAGPVTFGPVMAYVWAALAAIEPAFRTATDASDPAIRELMKLPASAADLGLALLVAYLLRARPGWAVVAAAGILLHPAVIDVSAWWGQYESIYLLSALAAAILAINGRNGWAAAAIAVSLMTKPQALPLLVPFAAWFWATGGWRELVRAGAIGAIAIAGLWLPFVADGGPGSYLRNVGQYQGDIFNVLSLRAWNPWWLVQEANGGAFVADNVPFAGPISLRVVGYAIAGLLEVAVLRGLLRNPGPQAFLLALAASVLVAFVSLTTMHERYAYGALVFLAPLIVDSRLRWLCVAFGVTFTLNLLAAVPPGPEFASSLSVGGWLGVVGSVAMVACAASALVSLSSRRPDHATA